MIVMKIKFVILKTKKIFLLTDHSPINYFFSRNSSADWVLLPW